MKSVLVTGGLGFVGSHLVDRLLSEGSRVTIVDSLLSNVMPPSHYAGRCEVITSQIEDVKHRLMPPRECYHEIYHMACVVGPAAVLAHAGDMTRSIVASGEAVVELAAAHDAALILTSTSEVYGQRGHLGEDDNCIIPPKYTVRLEYAIAKLATEVAALNRAKVSPLRVNIVRPFNVAGSRQLPYGGFVLPRFVISAINGTPLPVFGDGRQVRAFTDVRDIVTGLIRTMRSGHTGLILNLGNPANELSIRDLAERVVRVAESRSSIVHVDPKEIYGPLYEEGLERVPKVEHASRALGWQPSLPLESTILETLAWYRERPELLSLEPPARAVSVA